MRRLFAALFGLLITLSLVGPVGAQESVATGVTTLKAYAVDASGAKVEVILAANSYDVTDPSTLVVSDSDGTLSGAKLSTTSSAGTPLEIAFVVDTRSSLAQGDAFEIVKATLKDSIASLPSGSRASVISASDSVVMLQEMTSDMGLVSAAIDDLTRSNSGAVVDAVTRATYQFEARPNTGTDRSLTGEAIRSIVVVSAGDDAISSATATTTARLAVQRGIQVFAVRYQGGTAALQSVVGSAGGLTLGASNVAELETAVTESVSAAQDRFIVSYPMAAEEKLRTDLHITVDSAATTLSFVNGRFTGIPTALAAVEVLEQGGPGFLHSGIGLYVALPLAFIAICLAIYAIGTLFFMGDTSLESLLQRYSNEGDSAELSEADNSIVQTALVQRAVEFSESFADDRGFLVKIEEMLEQASMPLRPGEAMSFLGVGVLAGSAIGVIFMGGIFGALGFAVLTAFLMIGYVKFKGKRRQKKFEQQLPDMLTLLAGTLRAGYSLPQGMEAVSHEIADPMGYEIRRVMTEAQLGRELEEALEAAAERMKSADFAWAVMAIGIQREVGGNLNELLMTVAETMIARERLRGEVAALTAEGKMTSFLLGGLPPGLGMVMWVMNPNYINKLFTTGLGNILIGLGVVTMIVGMAWMKKVMTINV